MSQYGDLYDMFKRYCFFQFCIFTRVCYNHCSLMKCHDDEMLGMADECTKERYIEYPICDLTLTFGDNDT